MVRVDEERLAEIPREELERLRCFPMAPHRSMPMTVVCAWHPDDVERREEARQFLESNLGVGRLDLDFTMPVEDAAGYLVQLLDVRYRREAPPEPAACAPPLCSACGKTGHRIVRGKETNLCSTCFGELRPSDPPRTACDFCDNPAQPIYGKRVSMCAGCRDLMETILQG